VVGSRKPRASPIAGKSGSDLALAGYNQNFETFRALNALMWQIPLIGMTLTGGLWFGVSKVSDKPDFQIALLFLAAAGNIALIMIMTRIRYVMGCYLDWLQSANPQGYVAAPGENWFTRSRRVAQTFRTVLGLAAATSLVLLATTMASTSPPEDAKRGSATAFYDENAQWLAFGYERLDSEHVHPDLFAYLAQRPSQRILDIGAGSGRDAAALAERGHIVTAVDPSGKMLEIAKHGHAGMPIKWIQDSLPALQHVQGSFDVILLSAVWMHIPPDEREDAFQRVAELLTDQGAIYITLRMGPDDPQRGIWAVSVQQLENLAGDEGFEIARSREAPDLFERDDVSWRALLLRRRGRT
jgi:SAM-dependent methyltransferase